MATLAASDLHVEVVLLDDLLDGLDGRQVSEDVSGVSWEVSIAPGLNTHPMEITPLWFAFKYSPTCLASPTLSSHGAPVATGFSRKMGIVGKCLVSCSSRSRGALSPPRKAGGVATKIALGGQAVSSGRGGGGKSLGKDKLSRRTSGRRARRSGPLRQTPRHCRG